MPQLVCTDTPSRLSMRSMRRAQLRAANDDTLEAMAARRPFASRCSTRPSHTVGTPTASRHRLSRRDQPRETRAIRMAPRQNELCTRRRHRERQAPGICMKHRVRRRARCRAVVMPMTSAWRKRSVCRKLERCVYVTPFGAPVVPEVKHRPHGRAFVEVAPRDGAARSGQRCARAGATAGLSSWSTSPSITNTCVIAGALATISFASDSRSALAIINRHSDCAEHRRQLRSRQPRIERVAHRAHPHDRVPRFDVRLRIPRQRRDTIAGDDVEIPQHRRNAQAALSQLRITHPVDVAAIPRGHHLRSRMPAAPRGRGTCRA